MDNCGGTGIKIISTSTNDLGCSLYDYCYNNKYVVEELIHQHEMLANLYNGSVNTIRFVMVNEKILDAVLRVGKNNSSVDNLCSGGIACPLDIEKGVVIGKGRDYLGNEYVSHPDSGVVFPGFLIPFFKESKELVYDVSALIKGIPVICWDFAVTENGPCIVEINEGTEIEALQVPFKKGNRFIWQ